MNNLEIVNKICPSSIHRNLNGITWWYVHKLKKQESKLKKNDKERLKLIVYFYKQGIEADKISFIIFKRY